MNNTTVEPTCPHCGAIMTPGTLDRVCGVCAWRDFVKDDATSMDSTDGVLFAVTGHDVLVEIARGGGGIVYRARQHEPRRDVALKIFPPGFLQDRALRDRFRLEAETIAALDHPAILPVYTVGEHDGLPFFTMKLAAGGSLATRCASMREHWRDIAELVAVIADGVQFAHARGVIHRDLKPGNVLFDDAGRAYVSDFGMAKFLAAESVATHPEALLGTPAYLAPEVLEAGAKNATTANDVYGLGTILYELLTGRPPFAGENIASILRAISDGELARPTTVVPRVPRDLETICLRALARNPADRFSSAGELAADLRRWLEGRPTQSRAVSPPERLAQWARRNPALAILSAALALAVVIGGAALARSNRYLRTALDRTRAAESVAQEQLHRALLTEARNKRESGRFGQRFEAIASLERAAKILPNRTVSGEMASALALPDFRLLQSFEQPSPSIRTPVAFGPDATLFARGLPEGGVGIFQTLDGARVRQLKLGTGVAPTGIAFSEEGSLIAVTHRRGAFVWNSNGVDPWLELPHALFALHPQVETVAFVAPNGAVVVRALGKAGDRVLIETDPSAAVRALSYNPDGSRLAWIRKGSLGVVDTESGVELWRSEADLLPVAPAWSGDGGRLAVARALRHEIALLDARTGSFQRPLVGHSGDPAKLAFHPDGRRLFSNAYDLSLRAWDVTSGQELLRAVLPVSGFRLSNDGQRLGAAIDAETPALFEAASEDVFREFSATEFSEARASTALLAASPDGRWLATSIGSTTTDTDGKQSREVQVRLWDTRTRREVSSFTFAQDGEVSLVFAHDAPAVLYGSSNTGVFRRSLDPRAGAFSIGPEERLTPPRSGLLAGWNKNGRDWFLFRPENGELRVWPKGQASNQRLLATLARVPGLTVSPDGRWAVAPVEGPALEIWSITEGSPLTSRKISLEREVTFEISPDSRWLVAGNDWGFRTWQLDGLEPGPTWPALRDGDRFRFAGFSADGRWLATEISQGILELRDGKTFAPLLRIEPPVDYALSRMAWAPDGAAIYLMGYGPRVFCWDLVALRAQLTARGME